MEVRHSFNLTLVRIWTRWSILNLSGALMIVWLGTRSTRMLRRKRRDVKFARILNKLINVWYDELIPKMLRIDLVKLIRSIYKNFDENTNLRGRRFFFILLKYNKMIRRHYDYLFKLST